MAGMIRTAAIAAIATCFGGAVAPLGLNPFEHRRVSADPAALLARIPQDWSEPAGHGLRLTRAEDGLFHAPIWINGRRATLIVDTGATVTVLTTADAMRLGIDCTALRDETTLRTAGGNASMRWATVRRLRIGGRVLADIEIAVVDKGLDHSLLGQDVLGSGGMLRAQGDVMEIS